VNGLDGRIAVVTGGARGIGEATARRLAIEGADIAIIDLDEAQSAQTAKAIAADTGRRAVGIGADVTDTDQVTAAVDRIAEQLGSPGILVNNAGIIAFLAGDDASFILGQTSYTDGGRRL